MATQTNPIVATRADGTIVRPNEYYGTTKSIPIAFNGDFADADSLVFTERFGQNVKLLGIHLENSALGGGNTVDIGVTGDPDSIIDGADVATAGEVNYQGLAVDVSNTAIVGTVQGDWAAGTLSGYFLITDDW